MNTIILPIVGLIACTVSQAAVTFMDGPIGNGDFSGNALVSGGLNLKYTESGWRYARSEEDWAIVSEVAEADSVAGTALSQRFLKSDYPAGSWKGRTALEFSVDWTTKNAGDTLEYAVIGYKASGTATDTNIYSNQSATPLAGAAFYSASAADIHSFLPDGISDMRDLVGSGAGGRGTFSASLNIAGADLDDYDLIVVSFISSIDADGKITIDNTKLRTIPEPSTSALLIGFASLGCLLLSRRRT